MELIPAEMLLAEIEDGKIAFHLTVEENHVEILYKLCVLAEEGKLNPNELKKKLLINKDQYE